MPRWLIYLIAILVVLLIIVVFTEHIGVHAH